jgi:hypothetical protein
MRAFGLDLEADFDVVGLEPTPDEVGPRRTSVELATAEAVADAWGDPAGAERISDRAMAIDAARDVGYLVHAGEFGQHLIAPGGDHILCGISPGDEPWRWQRLLIGQLLPFAALLQGLECLHASAVVRDDGAVAIVGAPAAGKTTLAALLTLRGYTFLTDDVLAVEASGDGVLAHPGAGLANVRSTGRAVAPDRLGRPIGEADGAVRVTLPRHRGAVPLRLLILLDRGADAPDLELERPTPLDPRLLLAASFNFVVQTPERLRTQLEVCARIAERVAVLRATVPPGTDPESVAARIDAADAELM